MWKLARRRLRYYLQFVPFTLNTVLCIAAIWLMHRVLYGQPGSYKAGDISGRNDDAPISTLQPFILLMAKIAFVLLMALIALSVLSALFAWLHYLWLKRRKGPCCNYSFRQKQRQAGATAFF